MGSMTVVGQIKANMRGRMAHGGDGMGIVRRTREDGDSSLWIALPRPS